MSLNGDLQGFYNGVHAEFDDAAITTALGAPVASVKARLIHDVEAAQMSDVQITQNEYIIAVSSMEEAYRPVDGHRIVLNSKEYAIGQRLSYSNAYEYRVVGSLINA